MFEIITNKEFLEGTCYFELLDGKYKNQCWNYGSLFISEEDFTLVEDIFEKTNNKYDHYSFIGYNQIHIAGLIIELEKRYIDLEKENYKISGSLFTDRYYNQINDNILSNKENAKKMINEIIKWIRGLKNTEMTVMGM